MRLRFVGAGKIFRATVGQPLPGGFESVGAAVGSRPAGFGKLIGLGAAVENLRALRCDAFSSGCHKWLYGPRGTGILWATARMRELMRPTIPSFDDAESYGAWLAGAAPGGIPGGLRLTPGGFHSFEHRWALPEAFAFHDCNTGQSPTGRVWFYDISDPSNPTAVGSMAPPRGGDGGLGICHYRGWVPSWCLSHGLDWAPGTHKAAVTWFTGGVAVVDVDKLEEVAYYQA